MKVLLINPSQKETYGNLTPPSYPPLGLGYIAAVLEKEKHDVQIIDIDADNITENQLINLIKQNFNLVGITSTSTTFKNAEKICETIKKYSNITTVVGGIHPTIAPEESIKSPYIDIIVRHEGEETIIALVNALKNNTALDDIPGISFKKNSKIIHNKDKELVENLDTIPFPARHLFRQQKYTYPDSLASPVVPIITSRGCPHLCTYCCSKQLFTRKVRFRSAVNVVDEIEHLIKTYGAKEIHIWDDTFTLNKKRVFEFRDEIKKRNIKINFMFSGGLRVDHVNEDILKALKEIGAYSLAFGVESGSQKILDNVKKGITLEQVEKTFKIAKNLGFELWGFFMIGLPGETPETVRATIDFAKKLDPDVAKFHILKPFPGSEVYRQFKEQGLLIEEDYTKYGIHTRPVHRLPDLSDEDLMQWTKTAYREFYLRPKKILAHIKRIKSWERLKLNASVGFKLLSFMKESP